MSLNTYTNSSGVLTPAGNQIIAERQTELAARLRQQQQSVQLTSFTWIQNTDGVGVSEFRVDFDVSFTAQPVIGYGVAVIEAGNGTLDPNTIPLSNVLVRSWLRDSQGLYVGAICIAVVRVPCQDEDEETPSEPSEPETSGSEGEGPLS